MILLLSYSKSWCQSELPISSKGDVDSVLVSYNDLRIANSKMIELKYQKAANDTLRAIVANDRVIIGKLNESLEKYKVVNDNLNNVSKKQKKNLVIFKSTTVLAIVGLVIAVFK